MPNIIDSTVINQAYDTSGNGGRKIVRLDNGTLISCLKNTTSFFVYKSEDNGLTWTQRYNNNQTLIQDIALVAKGEKIYVLATANNKDVYCYVLDERGTGHQFVTAIDTGQSAIGNVSLAINEAKTELHATWASKNSTYPNSFNIRYSKGTIGVDGNVTWGAVEQRTTWNSTGLDCKNPTIILNTLNNPVIIFERSMAGSYGIRRVMFDGVTWTANNSDAPQTLYNGGSYIQSSPSVIFVPKSINGLANGRIWVAWRKYEATGHTIATSYSDDGGTTWSIPVNTSPLTTSTPVDSYKLSPIITVNKSNVVFVLYTWFDSTGNKPYQVRMVKLEETSWSNEIILVTNDMLAVSNSYLTYPSALADTNTDFEVPLFIYRDAKKGKVGFYGTWSTTEISVPEGSIGAVSDKNNLLTYSITSDGEMGEIVEKVNGTVVGTKTAVSGETLTVRLSQEQWDAVKFGKYNVAIIDISHELGEWEQGNRTFKDGDVPISSASQTRLRTKNAMSVIQGGTLDISINSGFNFYIGQVDSNNRTVKEGSWQSSGEVKLMPRTSEVWINIKKSDGAETIGLDELVNIGITIYGKERLDNTLTVEMGENKWKYAFDKQLSSDADMLSIAKAVKDSQDTYLPAVKSNLIKSLKDKDGTLSEESSFEDIVNTIETVTESKKESDITTMSSSLSSFMKTYSGSMSFYSVSVTEIGFTPTLIIINGYHVSNNESTITVYDARLPLDRRISVINGKEKSSPVGVSIRLGGAATVGEGSFNLPVGGILDGIYEWTAYK